MNFESGEHYQVMAVATDDAAGDRKPSGPGSTAPSATTDPDGHRKGRTDPDEVAAFISYPRRPTDEAFVDELCDALHRKGKRVWLDRHDIPPGSEWRERVTLGVEGATSFVFVLSPDSVTSSECRFELDTAVALHKRIVPLMRRDFDLATQPYELAKREWIDFRPGTDRVHALDELIDSLESDLAWRDMHTRLAVRAREWESQDQDKSYLLRGRDLRAAEAWLAQQGSHPERPTAEQGEFIAASRRSGVRRQRLAMGAISLALVLTLVLGAVAVVQRGKADDETRQALGRELAAESSELLPRDVGLSGDLALESYVLAPSSNARNAVLADLAQPLEGIAKTGNGSEVDTLSFARSGRDVVVGDNTGQVIGLSLTDRRAGPGPDTKAPTLRIGSVFTLPFGDSIEGVALNPTGDTLAVAAYHEPVYEYGGSQKKPKSFPVPGKGWAVSIGFGDGDRLLALDQNGNLWGLPATGGTNLQRLVAGNGTQLMMAADPKGPYVATGTDDGTVVLTNLDTGATSPSLALGDPSPISSMAFSPDGSMVAAADLTGRLEVWRTQGVWSDVAHAELAATTADSTVECLSFSHDGRELATGDLAGRVTVWNSANLAQSVQLPGDGHSVWSVAFSPTTDLLAVGDQAGDVSLWDTATDQSALRSGTDPIDALAVGKDGRWLAAGDSAGSTSLWQLPNRTVVRRLSGDGVPVEALAISPDQTRLLLGDADGVQALDMATMSRARTQEPDPWPMSDPQAFDSVAYTGADTVVTGDFDGGVARWDAGSSRPTWSGVTSKGASVNAVAISDGRIAAGDNNGDLVVWNPAKRTTRWLARNQSTVYEDVAFSPDGQVLAAADESGSVTLWNLLSGQKPITLMGQGSPIDRVAFVGGTTRWPRRTPGVRSPCGTCSRTKRS